MTYRTKSMAMYTQRSPTITLRSPRICCMRENCSHGGDAQSSSLSPGCRPSTLSYVQVKPQNHELSTAVCTTAVCTHML